MIDAALEYAERGFETWFITVKPSGFISGGERPAMASIVPDHRNLKLIAPRKTRIFELGTRKGRSMDYAITVINNVPAGTPVILSDDTAVWAAGKLISGQYPVVGVLHSDDSVYYKLYREYGKYFSGIVAVSERIKSKALKLNKLDFFEVIPCSLKLPDFGLSRKNEKLQLFWAGRIEERQKRVSDIPRIAVKLKDEKIEFHWTLSGHGDDRLLLGEIQKLGLEKNFTFTGWIDREELYRIMDNSDLLVLPSNFEGMPVIVMEALSKGLGVVSSKVSGVEDLEKDSLSKDALVLYDIGDIGKAVEGIIKLADIPEELRIKTSRRLAEKYYSIQSCIDQYERLISHMDISVSNNRLGHLKWHLLSERIKSMIISLARYLKYTLYRKN